MNHYFMLWIALMGLSVSAFAQKKINADQELQALIGKKANIGVGAAYAVNGEIKWANSAGHACQESEMPFTTTTLTRIASITKSMTAVAIMQLVEKELIELDVPLQTYLSNFPKKEKGDITIRQLLSHTSGVSQYHNDKEVENTKYFESLEAAMKVFEDRPLLFKPGSKYFYTTYGYVILGRVIEVVTNSNYADYMQKNIFDVAKMNNTGVEDANKSYENKSCLYHKRKRRAKKGKQNDLSNRIPGGGFYSTVEDVLKFGNALLEGKFIKDSTLQIMCQQQDVVYDGNEYGLGWFFYGTPPHQNVVIGHGGGQTGCTSQLMIIPKSKTVVVVLSNTSRTYPAIATFASKLIQLSESEAKE